MVTRGRTVANWMAAAFFLGLALASPLHAAGRIKFSDQSYYGRPTEKPADRAYFAKLEQRFADRPYRQVRAELIRSGYRPVRLKRVNADMDCPIDEERSEYPETLVCSGTGIAGRTFLFHRPGGKGYAIVVTYGETIAPVTHLRAATREDMEIFHMRQTGRNYP
jgi:hypothetical protein